MEVGKIIQLCFFFFCISWSLNLNGVAQAAIKVGSSGSFNVMDFGARANEVIDDSKAFMATWKAACESTGSATILVPKGTYVIGPVQFQGPCTNVSSITFNVQGTVKALPDLKQFGSVGDWVQFGSVNGLTLTGGGTFDGQGAKAWPYNTCPKYSKCKLLPNQLKFNAMNNTVIKGITSVDSKFYHVAILRCNGLKIDGVKISAPGNSPNTDGIHVERSSDVTISSTTIGTGDDCISIGHRSSQISIRGVNCGPGHGISVGSLGKYPNEGDVTGITITDCKLSGTTNGVRIKTWSNSPSSSSAHNMTFENIIMDNVQNPIIIDQAYCPYLSCSKAAPSRVKISDISFKNIRGTSATPTAVILRCSKGIPCENVKLQDIHLNYHGAAAAGIANSTCENVRASYSGTQIPPPCG